MDTSFMPMELKQLKYNQARLAIMKKIADLQLKAGEQIPSTRELIRTMPFGEITILHALNALKDDGIIIRRHGSGTYLAQELKDTSFRNNILYVFIMKKDEPVSGWGLEQLRLFLANRGLGLNHVGVYEFGTDIVEASKNSIGILVDGWITDEFLQRLAFLKLPVMTLGNKKLTMKIPNVSADLKSAARRLTELFIKNGLKKIAVMPGTENYDSGKEYVAGYLEAIKAAGLEPFIYTAGSLVELTAGLDKFMDGNRDLEGILMEPSTFFDLSSWLIRTGNVKPPQIGFLCLPRYYRQYRQSPQFRYVLHDNIEMTGAEILYNHAVNGEELYSKVISPFIPGVDDDNLYFMG